ncbi:ProQ/FINO family protein [Consotaella salsifontis]|uniref:ProQ/FINO family protein n=1 Tax=Consotaella salsifontis TaxID=1365950 RepID=A0A1T4ST77_9HYPH|nr:ProQ/FinO family protein [Consotaella salsifontis]SKA31088.1 ProQ/FINO family protein [Consotaella salsifontis]
MNAMDVMPTESTTSVETNSLVDTTSSVEATSSSESRSTRRRRIFRERARRGRAALAESFPKCFAAHGADKTPLKIGIYHDIIAAMPDISRGDLRSAMFDYTNGRRYLRNVVEGAPRIDLAGEPSGVVTAEEATYAAGKMAGR